MRIIAVANQKGGCGKTTTAINLAYSLSIRQQKVLLIDCDPQAHATMGLKIKPSDIEKTMYHVLTPQGDERPGIDDIIIPIHDNFDLAPSSIILSAIELELAGLPGREDRLHEAIQQLKRTYQYIIIDCPPSIGLLCFNALRACKEVIIPIDMSLFSLRGIAKLLEIIVLIRDQLGHEIASRPLITMFDTRTRYARRVMEKVTEEFGHNAFATIIRYNIRLRETVDYGLPVGMYDKRSNGHNDYEKLAAEVINAELSPRSIEETKAEFSQNLLQKTDTYIDKVMQQPLSEQSETDTDPEDYLPQAYKSSYPEMIRALEFGSADALPEDDSEFEDYQD